LAWIYLKGKCFIRQAKISISYPLVEFITAILFVLNSFFSGSLSSIYSLNLIGLNIFAVILLISSIIDFDNMIIPNEVILIGSISGFIFNLISLDSFGNESFFYVLYQFVILSLLGAISIEFLNFLISLIIKKDAFGFGDIKFLFLIGCWLGFKGIYLTLLLSLYIGGLFTIVLIIFNRISKKGKIPFGPYLSISGYIVGIVGSNNISTILKKIYSLG
jgi:leader peptidase (prepilin peptidase)/N-methyltransferase